ncbi:hypothetical protein PALB_8270 [Pseudoalteromonas luteoviolacea B = ATCC 29581]|nr:hypothetical protein PALB_8270 [Pseudoalteromonas luteoviolacea B = ATCC 29581]
MNGTMLIYFDESSQPSWLAKQLVRYTLTGQSLFIILCA